jgi:hypothetical protein
MWAMLKSFNENFVPAVPFINQAEFQSNINGQSQVIPLSIASLMS